MVALCNRADHYIFMLWFVLSSFFLLSSFFPRLISAVGDWMFTILWHMVYCTSSSSGRQPNFAALKRGRHLCSAGRPSGWALAHILAVDLPTVSYARSFEFWLLFFYRLPVLSSWLRLHVSLLTVSAQDQLIPISVFSPFQGEIAFKIFASASHYSHAPATIILMSRVCPVM